MDSLRVYEDSDEDEEDEDIDIQLNETPSQQWTTPEVIANEDDEKQMQMGDTSTIAAICTNVMADQRWFEKQNAKRKPETVQLCGNLYWKFVQGFDYSPRALVIATATLKKNVLMLPEHWRQPQN